MPDHVMKTARDFPMPEWMPEEFRATFEFARAAHVPQIRKYTGDPYIVHPIDVFRRLQEGIRRACVSPTDEAYLRVRMTPVLHAALLHDTVEDCGTSLTEIEKLFGPEVAECVFWVTDTLTQKQGNRETRKRLEALRIAAAPTAVQCLKLADIASNTTSIVEHDTDFAVVYLKEKHHMMRQMMTKGFGAHDRRVQDLFTFMYRQALDNVGEQ